MKRGFKYALSETAQEPTFLPVDSDSDSFADTMHYDMALVLPSEEAVNEHFGARWQRELHAVYRVWLDPERLVVGCATRLRSGRHGGG